MLPLTPDGRVAAWVLGVANEFPFLFDFWAVLVPLFAGVLADGTYIQLCN